MTTRLKDDSHFRVLKASSHFNSLLNCILNVVKWIVNLSSDRLNRVSISCTDGVNVNREREGTQGLFSCAGTIWQRNARTGCCNYELSWGTWETISWGSCALIAWGWATSAVTSIHIWPWIKAHHSIHTYRTSRHTLVGSWAKPITISTSINCINRTWSCCRATICGRVRALGRFIEVCSSS